MHAYVSRDGLYLNMASHPPPGGGVHRSLTAGCGQKQEIPHGCRGGSVMHG